MRLDLIDACTRALRTVLGEDAPADAPLRWDIPKDPSFGDLSSSIAFKLAAKRRQPPHALAQDLATRMSAACGSGSPLEGALERIDSKAGFLNLTLSLRSLTQTVEIVNRQRERYGQSRVGTGTRILIEFVSANPTGPLSVAHGRQAAVGDALARLLRSQGYDATREYYLNDEGRQIEQLGLSLQIRYRQALGEEVVFPEDGYHGAYLIESGKMLAQQHGRSLLDKPREWFVEQGMQEQLAHIKDDLTRFGLTFETWTSQRELGTSGKIDAALQRLQAGGYLFEAEGATWFASTKFGDDKDRVVRKGTGELTYLAPDIAYHQQKCERGYDRLINLWGPDHHGYIPRVKAALQALGYPPERLVVKIVQLVTLSRQGKPVPMSKRQGEFVTFREILDEVGIDATRYFYLMRTMDSHLDFDLDLAKSQSQDNPVYYVQYAHARICSIAGVAREKLPWWRRLGSVRLELLDAPEERLLMRQLFQFPLVLRMCAEAQEPHGVTSYLQKLAELFHVFYTKCRVVTDDVPRSRARLALISATRWTLANGLGVLGVSAPQRM